jgi:hypothetical protein
MNPVSCAPSCCESVLPIQIPGPEGPDGTPGISGTDGKNAFTFTTADFTVPAIGANVVVLVANSDWMTLGQNVFVQTAGNFKVVEKPASTSVILQYLNYAGNVGTGNLVGTGMQVSPSGTQVDVSGIIELVDSTGGTISNDINSGVGKTTIALYITLANLTNADVITAYTPGYAFKLLKVSFGVQVAATTALKLATITPYISGVAVTGGILSLTSANCTPKGTIVAGSAITALNTGDDAATITLTASAVTAFVEGTGWILIEIQNTDVANALASLAAKQNELLTALAP